MELQGLDAAKSYVERIMSLGSMNSGYEIVNAVQLRVTASGSMILGVEMFVLQCTCLLASPFGKERWWRVKHHDSHSSSLQHVLALRI
jgi:hypothetical protein